MPVIRGQGHFFFPPFVYIHWAQQGLDIIWDHSEELTDIYSWADAFTKVFLFRICLHIGLKEDKEKGNSM